MFLVLRNGHIAVLSMQEKKNILFEPRGPHPCPKDALFLIVKFITWPDAAESIEIIIAEWEWTKLRSPVNRVN